ncbi:four helix bundle protein [Gilvibacter sp.]|uniref:four helix bundle protein n=1 Tax=Gilvibacter sp. TaxID=2729997 RepID=UPI0035BE314C
MGRHNFKKLKIWQEGMILVDETYKMTKGFPDVEKFNLVSQLIRCAVSIPSNIAEGTSKSTNKHFNKYIECSLGSSFEWETQLIVALNQKYISIETFQLLEHKIQQLQKMISKFQDGLNNRS